MIRLGQALIKIDLIWNSSFPVYLVSVVEPGNNTWEIICLRKRIFGIGHKRIHVLKETGVVINIYYNHSVILRNLKQKEV